MRISYYETEQSYLAEAPKTCKDCGQKLKYSRFAKAGGNIDPGWEQESTCSGCGKVTRHYAYKENRKTWWFDTREAMREHARKTELATNPTGAGPTGALPEMRA